MCVFSAWRLLALLPLAGSLVLRSSTSSFMLEGRPIDAYVIGSQQGGEARTRWTQAWNNSFSSLTFSDPVYVGEADIERLLDEGSIDPHYSSWYVKTFDRHNLMKNPKFPHELGCTLAHRKVWREFLERFDAGKSTPWAAVFEGDAILRSDFAQRVMALKSHDSFQYKKTTEDIIMLGHCFEACPSSLGNAVDLGANVHVVSSKQAVCTHAYLVSASGAKRLLGLTVPMKQAVDERIRGAAHKGTLNSLSVCPPISRQPWQKESDMYSKIASPDLGGAEFVARGGNASDFSTYMTYVQNLQ